VKNALFPALTVAAMLLTGCSSAETAASSATSEDATPAPTVSVPPASPSAEPAESSSAAPTPNRNERGEIIKAIGENTLEIETTADFEGPIAVNGVPGQIGFGPSYWKGYADNGTRMNTVDSNINRTCLANEALLLPDYIGKGERLNGQVILDVTTPTGTIVYSPDGGGSGWVWKYPSAG
jgi:hypothetical protein